MKATDATAEEVRGKVRQRYGATAKGESSCSDECCTSTNSDALGYSAEDAAAAPEAANLGLGCGNPLAIASLQPGQTVLDLGSGAGFDCFLAARAVGDTGHVIGVDMTTEMIGKAKENARKNGFTNVEFRLGEIEALPVAGQHRRRDHFQLCHQSLTRKTARLSRKLPRPETRRTSRRCRHRRDRALAERDRGRLVRLYRLHGRRVTDR